MFLFFVIYRFRQYGLWSRYKDLYPEKDLVFTIGSSNYSKDWFFSQVTRYTIILINFFFVIHFSRVYVYSVYCIVEPNYSNYNCNSGMWKMGRMSKQRGRLCSTLKVSIRAEITLSNWPSHQHITRTYRCEINFLFPHLNCFDLKIILY